MDELRHIVCPDCSAVNRIPSTRIGEGPKCGKCRTPLFRARVTTLTASNFEKHISRNDIPVVVDFWASWCGPCKMMAPAFAQAAATLEPSVRLAKLDTEAEQGIAARFGIQSIPTLVLFKSGREIARQPGAMGSADIIRWVQANTG